MENNSWHNKCLIVKIIIKKRRITRAIFNMFCAHSKLDNNDHPINMSTLVYTNKIALILYS